MTDMTFSCSRDKHEDRCYKVDKKNGVWCGYEYEREISKQEGAREEREKIIQKIKNMPENFPELESDDFDLAYKDAKQYLLNKLQNDI